MAGVGLKLLASLPANFSVEDAWLAEEEAEFELTRRLAASCPPLFLCPISLELMQWPVVLVETGQTYERANIRKWFFMGGDTCPLTGVRLKSTATVPDRALQLRIERWVSSKGTDAGTPVSSPLRRPLQAPPAEAAPSRTEEAPRVFSNAAFSSVPHPLATPRSRWGRAALTSTEEALVAKSREGGGPARAWGLRPLGAQRSHTTAAETSYSHQPQAQQAGGASPAKAPQGPGAAQPAPLAALRRPPTWRRPGQPSPAKAAATDPARGSTDGGGLSARTSPPSSRCSSPRGLPSSQDQGLPDGAQHPHTRKRASSLPGLPGIGRAHTVAGEAAAQRGEGFAARPLMVVGGQPATGRTFFNPLAVRVGGPRAAIASARRQTSAGEVTVPKPRPAKRRGRSLTMPEEGGPAKGGLPKPLQGQQGGAAAQGAARPWRRSTRSLLVELQAEAAPQLPSPRFVTPLGHSGATKASPRPGALRLARTGSEGSAMLDPPRGLLRTLSEVLWTRPQGPPSMIFPQPGPCGRAAAASQPLGAVDEAGQGGAQAGLEDNHAPVQPGWELVVAGSVQSMGAASGAAAPEQPQRPPASGLSCDGWHAGQGAGTGPGEAAVVPRASSGRGRAGAGGRRKQARRKPFTCSPASLLRGVPRLTSATIAKRARRQRHGGPYGSSDSESDTLTNLSGPSSFSSMGSGPSRLHHQARATPRRRSTLGQCFGMGARQGRAAPSQRWGTRSTVITNASFAASGATGGLRRPGTEDGDSPDAIVTVHHFAESVMARYRQAERSAAATP